MARRKLINIDDKILRETIRLGAVQGINNIPARKIAKNCDITDATVFEHFQTKSNLILQAKLLIDQDLLKIHSGIVLTKDKYESTVREAWEDCLDYFITHPSETKFYDRYRHSEYYHPTTSAEKDGLVHKIYEFLLSINAELRCSPDFAFQLLWAHVVETTINVALQVINGKMKKTPQSMDFVYKLLFGGIMEGITN